MGFGRAVLKLVVLVVVVALVFGGRGRLGDLLRALGEAPRRFRRGLKTDAVDEAKEVRAVDAPAGESRKPEA